MTGTMDLNKTILVPPLAIKRYQTDGWNNWFTQFKLRTLVTTFPLMSDQEKVAILLLKLGDEITPILDTFHVEVDKVSYDELVTLFSTYFKPVKARNVFFNAKQKSGESFDQFAERLAILGCPCLFGPFKDGFLRDSFIMNIDNIYSKIRVKILENHCDPSFQEVVTYAKNLLHEECNVSNGDSHSVSNKVVISAHSVDGYESSVSRNACTQLKRKERDLGSSTESNDRGPFSILDLKTPPSQTYTPLLTNQCYDKSDLTPNKSCPSTERSFKTSIDGKYSNSTKSASAFSFPSMEKVDFAFKCFSVEDSTKNSPCNRITDAEQLSSRSPVPNNLKMTKPTSVKNSDQRKQPLNFTFNSSQSGKPAGVNARLQKFGSQSNLGSMIRSAISPDSNIFSFDKSNSSVASKSHNDLSPNLHFQKDCGVNSFEKSYQATSSLIKNDVPRFTSQNSSNHGDPSQRMCKEKFPTVKADTNVAQTYSIGAAGLSTEHGPNPEPPVSKHCYSDVVIVFISENNTIFVCPVVKYQYLQTIEKELGKLFENNALQSIKQITIGEKYAAPFQGDWYRAEIVSANLKKETARISFCDYGNEEDVPLNALKLLPEEFKDLEPLSFPIRLPKNAPQVLSGSKLKIRPLSLEEDCIWAVELSANH